MIFEINFFSFFKKSQKKRIGSLSHEIKTQKMIPAINYLSVFMVLSLITHVFSKEKSKYAASNNSTPPSGAPLAEITVEKAPDRALYNDRNILLNYLFYEERIIHNSNQTYNNEIIPLFWSQNQKLEEFEEKGDPGEGKEKSKSTSESIGLDIYVSIWIKEIVSFDTLNQLLTFTAKIQLNWQDERLIWNQNNFNNVTSLRVPLSKVWIPEIGVVNSATANGRFYDEVNLNRVYLENDGYITWVQAFEHIVKCPMMLEQFPFDLQYCNINLGALTDREEVNLVLVRPGDEDIIVNIFGEASGDASDTTAGKKIAPISEMTQTSLNVWTFLGNHIGETIAADKRTDITYVIFLKRKSTLYLTDIFVPCSLLSFLSGCSLFVIQDLNCRLDLNLSVLVALSVYQMIASGNLPHTDNVPLLSVFLLVNLVMVYLTLAYTVFMWQVTVNGSAGKDRDDLDKGTTKKLHTIIVKKIGPLYRFKSKISPKITPKNNTDTNFLPNGSKITQQAWDEITAVVDKMMGTVYLILFLSVIVWAFSCQNDAKQLGKLIENIREDVEDFECNKNECFNA